MHSCEFGPTANWPITASTGWLMGTQERPLVHMQRAKWASRRYHLFRCMLPYRPLFSPAASMLINPRRKKCYVQVKNWHNLVLRKKVGQHPQMLQLGNNGGEHRVLGRKTSSLFLKVKRRGLLDPSIPAFWEATQTWGEGSAPGAIPELPSFSGHLCPVK